MIRYFAWTSDLNNDGTPETLRYASALWIPTVDAPDGGGKARIQRIETLDGNVQVLGMARSGKADSRVPGQFSLSWDTVPDDLLSIIEEDYCRQRVASVQVDHRWRTLEVTSSGYADLTAYVARGAWRYSVDTYWPDSTLYGYEAVDAIPCIVEPGHTKICAVVSGAGAFTLGSTAGTLPADSAQLATISVTGNRVTIESAVTGVANARTVRILDYSPKSISTGGTSLALTLQEIA